MGLHCVFGLCMSHIVTRGDHHGSVDRWGVRSIPMDEEDEFLRVRFGLSELEQTRRYERSKVWSERRGGAETQSQKE